MRRLTTMLVLALVALVAMAAWAAAPTTPITGADNLAAAVETTAPTTSLHVATPAPPKTAAVATTEPATIVEDTSSGTSVTYKTHEVAPNKHGTKVVANADVGGGLGSVAKA